jgi:hypothetical protein
MSLLNNPQLRWYGKDDLTLGMAKTTYTQFERIILQLLHMTRWLQVAVVLLLLAFPFDLAAIEGLQTTLSTQGWRNFSSGGAPLYHPGRAVDLAY